LLLRLFLFSWYVSKSGETPAAFQNILGRQLGDPGSRLVDQRTKLEAIDAYRKHDQSLPNLLGVQLEEVGESTLSTFLDVQSHHLNPAHSSCHAATMVALADTACGWGCIAHLPEGASSFTTVDLTCNLLRAVTSGRITCDATLIHGGRTTQVWDAIVTDADHRSLAAFRCTQLVIYT
jgi:uncharacterized protein (TIGR00369 family)